MCVLVFLYDLYFESGFAFVYRCSFLILDLMLGINLYKIMVVS